MKQYKIGIIGTENSHAYAFASLINLPYKDGKIMFPDCRVTHVYGQLREPSEILV